MNKYRFVHALRKVYTNKDEGQCLQWGRRGSLGQSAGPGVYVRAKEVEKRMNYEWPDVFNDIDGSPSNLRSCRRT